MNHLLNLIRKELRELLTPSSLASVIVMMVVFIALGSVMSGEISSQMDTQPIGYSDLTDDEYDYSDNSIAYLKEYYKVNYKVDPEKYVIDLGLTTESTTDDIQKAMADKGVSSAIIFPTDFNTNIESGQYGVLDLFWNQTSTSVFSSLSSSTALSAVSTINQCVSAELMLKSGIDPTEIGFIQSPTSYSGATFFNGTLHENVRPDEIYSAMSNQTMFVPIIIMLVIVMIGSILISSMGNEKENKTLETLLTLPVNRTTIVTGKLIGSAIAGLVMGAFYMVGMYFYISGINISTSSGVSMESLGLSLSATDWIVVVAFMFVSILCALGMCMILGAFAKNYKAAQMYIMPISVLAMIPMFATMFTNVADLPTIIQVVLYAIPFTHPMLVMQNLMFGNTMMLIGGFVYIAIFAAVMILITVKLYKSDILLTGLIRKSNGKIALFSKKE